MRHKRDVVRARTHQWVHEVVIGLNLCPFAKAVAGDMAIEVYEGQDMAEMTEALSGHISTFVEACDVAVPTTLFVTPNMLSDFLDYNDYLRTADTILYEKGLDGILQIASFHPDYRFAGADRDDPANYTNRSPYPMFHLLREDHVSAAIERFPDTTTIPETNIRLLREMGASAMRDVLASCLSTESPSRQKTS